MRSVNLANYAEIIIKKIYTCKLPASQIVYDPHPSIKTSPVVDLPHRGNERDLSQSGGVHGNCLRGPEIDYRGSEKCVPASRMGMSQF